MSLASVPAIYPALTARVGAYRCTKIHVLPLCVGIFVILARHLHPQLPDFLARQGYFDCAKGIMELSWAVCPNNRASNRGSAEKPGQGDLGNCRPARLADLFERVHDCPAALVEISLLDTARAHSQARPQQARYGIKRLVWNIFNISGRIICMRWGT